MHDEQEYKLKEINKMNDCLLKLRKENQIVIDRLKSISKNNEDMNVKCKEREDEKTKIEAEIVNVQNELDNNESWEICGQIREIESKLSNVKHE